MKMFDEIDLLNGIFFVEKTFDRWCWMKKEMISIDFIL